MNSRQASSCAPCILLGQVAPWAMLITGGMIGLMPVSPYWAETSAWLCAVGIALLGLSYLLGRLSKPHIERV